MAPDTADTRPARKGPRLRQEKPDKSDGGTGTRNWGIGMVPSRATSSDERAIMVSDSRGKGRGGRLMISALHPLRPNCRVYLRINDRACGRSHRKKPSASGPSLKTTNNPVPAVLSHPNRAFAVHARAWLLYCTSVWNMMRGVKKYAMRGAIRTRVKRP